MPVVKEMDRPGSGRMVGRLHGSYPATASEGVIEANRRALGQNRTSLTMSALSTIFEDTSFFSPKRGFLFRFLYFSFFSASTTTARL
jgi:hypothetical protein